MKKLTVLLLIMTMSVSMIACGNTNNTESSSAPESSQETVVEESTEEVIEESVEEVLPEEEIFAEPTMSEEMTAIRQAVVDAVGENYFPQMQIPAEYMEGFGLSADMYEEFFGEMPMISTNVDTLIVVKAAEGQLEAVEGVMNAYRDNLVNDTMQYPMNVGKIQASEVKTIGNYVCFVQLGGDVMAALEQGDEAVIKHCQEQNATAIAALEGVINQ
jgi:hypothetical protein